MSNRDDRLAKLEQKFDDFLGMYTEDREKLNSLTKRVNKMETPIKWVSGLVTVSAVGVFTALGEKVARWMLHR